MSTTNSYNEKIMRIHVIAKYFVMASVSIDEKMLQSSAIYAFL